MLTKKALLLSIFAFSQAHAALELAVVQDYKLAESAPIWEKVKADQLPQGLMSLQEVSDPSSPYAAAFPKSFMQEKMFSVCHHDCADKEIYKVQKGDITKLNYKDDAKWDVTEQSNVYFWASRYFKFLDERFSFSPNFYLKIMTNRTIKENSSKLKNNAFFNPADLSLSFLPASNNPLFNFLNGKINRSGFDPSVIAHEASHFFFHHLYPLALNAEIAGLNEGFSDYIANIFLDSPKVGSVMMRGTALRDSSQPKDKAGNLKIFVPGMEVHDIGERVSFALWTTRKLVPQGEELDRMVVDAIQEMAQTPYAGVVDFKIKMLVRIKNMVADEQFPVLENFWNTIFPGNEITIANMNFLKKPRNGQAFLGFKMKQTYSPEMVANFGVNAEEKYNLNFIASEKISETQMALLVSKESGENISTPYWIVIDDSRKNTDLTKTTPDVTSRKLILGIFHIDGSLVTEKKEVESVKTLATQVINSAQFFNSFAAQIKEFADIITNQGDATHKVTKITTSPDQTLMQGRGGNRIDIKLKKKILGRLLPGIPEVETLSIFTVPGLVLKTIPQVNGEQAIGYSLKLKSGVSTEVILDRVEEGLLK